jgi:predicted phage terminase large subunit-like protein
LLTDDEILELEELIRHENIKKSKSSLLEFTKYTFPEFDPSWFHKTYYNILDKFAKGEIQRLIISCPPQHGKEICKNEPILTTKGFKNHGDLIVGDYVFNELGEPIKVLENIDQPEPCDVEVEFTNGVKMKCHRNHEWGLYHRGKYKVLETTHLLKNRLNTGEKGKRGSKYNYKLPLYECLKFNEQKTNIDPYLLGVWIGDGSKSSFTITLSKDDFISITKEIKDNYTEKEVKTTRNIRVLNSMYKLRGYDLLNNKHIPKEYIYNTKENRLNLLAGLIDTDGYLHQKSGQYKFTNTNKKVIDDVCLLLRTLGITYSTTKQHPRKEPNSFGIQDKKVCWQIAFTPNTEIPCKVDRKKSKKIISKRRVSIKNVRWLKQEEKEEGNCIHVDSDNGIYLAGKDLIPTHNSEGSTRRLPAYLLGRNPDIKIAIASYNSDLASDFNRDVQRIIDDPLYYDVFDDTLLNESNVVTVSGQAKRNSKEFEIVGKKGSLKAIGVGGGLTGKKVDVMIMDDLYKDIMSATSPLISDTVWKWYTSVVRKRMRNKSQELIVFTRWDENDLVGRLEQQGKVKEFLPEHDLEELLDTLEYDEYIKINFPALKIGKPNELDPREEGDSLWESEHSRIKLEAERELDPQVFEALNQGNPRSKEGLLYSDFGEYLNINEEIIIKSYTDTADSGDDYLCSIVYGVPLDKEIERIYIIDVLYTQKSMEYTEPDTAEMIIRNESRVNKVESNNGGKGFSRAVEKIIKEDADIPSRYVITWFHQSKNKESRIITNAASVNRVILFPIGWQSKWATFYNHISSYKKVFKANKYDDAEDCITSIYEEEYGDIPKPIARINWG